MDSPDPNIHSTSELEELRLENERLKALLEAKSGNVLNHVPVAIWEEDFSDVNAFFGELRKKGVDDFQAHFSANPKDVEHCSSLIKVLSINKAAMEMTGIDQVPEKVTDLPRFFSKESETVFVEEFVALASGQTHYQSDAVTVDLDGKNMQIIFQVNVVNGHESDLSKVLVTVTDITEEAILKSKLDRSETKWKSIFESVVDGIMVIDSDLKILRTNHSSLRRPTNFDPVGKYIHDLVIPELREEAKEFYQNVFETGQANKTEHRSPTSQGYSIHDIVASPVQSDGQIKELVVVARNMTSQRKTEQELSLSEARWNSIINHASDLIYIVNQNMIVTEANEPALTVISDKMIGNNIQDVIMPGNARVVRDMISQVFESQDQVQTVIEIIEGDYKGHQYSCDMSPLPNPDGSISAIVIARDVTESKNLEKQVLDALIQGQERERKRVARELHDGLGQLFTAMNMNLQVFRTNCETRMDEESKSQLNELSNIVSQAISEVKGISRDLLPDVLNHHGLIPAIKDVIQALESGKVKILLDAVEADRRYPAKVELAIFRAFQELLNNAIKYAEADTIHIQVVDHDSSIALSVEDDGIGIADSELSVGNGIGNTNARAEALGGTFHVEGSPGKGTLAYIEIPINNLE